MKLTYKMFRIPLLVGLCLCALVIGVRKAGVWLLVSDPVPQSVDVVFTFAGSMARVSYSRELMDQFRNAKWFLSDYENGYASLLRKNDFEMSRVAIVDTCKSTLDEVRALFNFLDNNAAFLPGKPVVALVSSPYHMRRIQVMVHRQKKLAHVTFRYLPVPLERYNESHEMYQQWWKYSVVSDVVFSELPKIVYFYFFQ